MTRKANLPPGYLTFRRTERLTGGARFEEAAAILLHWEVQRRAGIRLTSSSDVIVADAVVDLRLGPGRLSVLAPRRVIKVIDERDRQGFAYGRLPGHPEAGEEAFALDRHEDGSMTFTITAFSRPATVLSKLAWPIGRSVQDHMTGRYLRSLG